MEELVENIIWQADYFLKESGEFYPFASTLNQKGEIKPLGILLENDKPSPFEVLDELDKVLKKGKEKGIYKAFAIGVNVSLVANPANLNLPQKSKAEYFDQEDIDARLLKDQEAINKDALEIRISKAGHEGYEIIQVPYFLNLTTREIQYGDFIKKE